MKVGLCTAGGDCPGLNAAIRAVVKHAIGSYGFEVWGLKDSFNGLMEKPFRIERLKMAAVTEIMDRGGTILGTTNAGNPFKIKADTGEICDQSQKVMEGYRELGLDALIVIGGDGSQTIASQFASLGMNIVGIPKTIDNDLLSSEVSIGFHTAVATATDAVTRLKTTAESHDRIMVLELMGRDAGHIALHAGIAGGANIILVPEIPFETSEVVAKIRERQNLGRNFSIVVVAEGAFEKGGVPTYKQTTTAKHTTSHIGGIGAIVAEKLHQETGIDTRITVLGHVQRGGSPITFDRVLASAFGVYATDLVAAKKFGAVVGIRHGKLDSMPFSQLSNRTQPIEADSIYLKTAESIGISLGRANNHNAID